MSHGQDRAGNEQLSNVHVHSMGEALAETQIGPKSGIINEQSVDY